MAHVGHRHLPSHEQSSLSFVSASRHCCGRGGHLLQKGLVWTNFGPGTDVGGTSGWFAVAVTLQPSWVRASLRTNKMDSTLLQVTNLFAANTVILVAQYRPVCHEPFGAVRAAQSSALKCVRRHHMSMVRVVLVSDFHLQGCTQQLRHDVCA